jgi:hypothetical protein
VVAEQQIVGYLADRRTLGIAVTADGEQQLMVCRRQPRGQGLLGAPPLEMAQTGP